MLWETKLFWRIAMSNETPSFIEIAPSMSKTKYTKQEKNYHCEAWKKSGKSMRAYCGANGIALSSFSQWANKEQKSGNVAEQKAVSSNIRPSGQPVEIVLTSGLRLRFSKTPLSELLRLIKGLESCS